MKRWVCWVLAGGALSGCGGVPVVDAFAPSCSLSVSKRYEVAWLTFVGDLRVEVRDADGKPIAGAAVGVRPKEYRRILCAPPPHYATDDAGVLELKGIRTGSYQVVLFNGEWGPNYESASFYQPLQEAVAEVDANAATVVTLTRDVK